VIVVDTNVVSELMRPSPSPLVRDWVNAQAPGELCTTAVTVAEVRYGLERLPDGRRKDSLQRIHSALRCRCRGLLRHDRGPTRPPRPPHRRLRRADSRHLPDTRRSAGHAQHQ
jgi:predicted nucleic acid-binding protein